MFKLDFDKIGALATLVKAGMSIEDIKKYAEVVETSPDLPKDAALEDIKEQAEIKDFEAPKPKEEPKEDPVQTIANLLKEE